MTRAVSPSSVGSVNTAKSRPLFSAVWFGRNRVESARDTIEALHTQNCSDYELVVEDCGSTDGTLELFEAAAAADPRIRIFRRFSTSSAEVLLSAIRRCRGDYVAICPGEGHFVPTAFDSVARVFVDQPTVGAICTDGFLINGSGKTLDRADIVALLLTTYRPFLPAAFFRREALLEAGLDRDDWLLDSLALELCYRVAIDRGLAFFPERLVHSRNPVNQADGLVHDVAGAIDDRLRLIDHAFSRDGFFAGASDTLALESKANHLAILWQEYRALQEPAIEYRATLALSVIVSGLYEKLRVDHRTLRHLHRLFCVRSHNLGLLALPLQKVLAAASRMTGRWPIHIGYVVWSVPLWGYWLIRKIVLLTQPADQFHSAAPSWDAMYSDLYALAGQRYETRGQIDLALAMWDRARPPDDLTIDSIACQAMLKSPTATDASLAEQQRTWVRRHLGDRPLVTLPPRAHNKVRIGYHCGFMHGDTMRLMMRNVIAAHDRDKFEIYGYAPLPVPDDTLSTFDVWRLTPSEAYGATDCRDDKFAALVKADEIDVFVECTGFSAAHRFGAMSLRCAPVQVSFLNHTGTSQVPNVDYVLSDEICVPSNSECQQHYSEKIYRLPGCFFCFDYTVSNEPPLSASPHLTNRYITFGCFASGGKIGQEIIEIWAKILHRVPNSILHIQNTQLSLRGDRRYLTDRFRNFGISPNRLVIERGVDRAALLEVYSDIDISLDTWPYCGGNTIAESLWHGVPVISYLGNRFSSRYGASLLTAAGCADLVTHSPEQFIERAAELASNSDRLVHLRRNLRQMSVDFGLGNSKLFARRLEEAFMAMLADQQARTLQDVGKPPPVGAAIG